MLFDVCLSIETIKMVLMPTFRSSNLFNSVDGQMLSREFIIDTISFSKMKHPSIEPAISHHFSYAVCVYVCVHDLAEIHLI